MARRLPRQAPAADASGLGYAVCVYRDRRYSPLEAAQLLERAAAKRADHTLSMAEVRAAGKQLGLTSGDIEKASVGHSPAAGADESLRRSAWAGGLLQFRLETSVPGEIRRSAHPVLVDEIRRNFSVVGQAEIIGRSISWRPLQPFGREAEVSIVPSGGRTTIRIHENQRHTLGQLFGGILGGVGGGGLGLWMPLGVATGFGTAFVVLLCVVHMLMVYELCRRIFRRRSDKRLAEQRALLEKLRELVAAMTSYESGGDADAAHARFATDKDDDDSDDDLQLAEQEAGIVIPQVRRVLSS